MIFCQQTLQGKVIEGNPRPILTYVAKIYFGLKRQRCCRHCPCGGIIVGGTEPHSTTNAKSCDKNSAHWAV